MTDINLKDFDKKNWDEFVHLRALQDVINQENAVNNEQNQQITQNTNDVTTAKQTATDAKTSADAARSTANDAKTTAENAQSTANDNKTALDGLTDKVSTAQSTADDAKSAAAENKTNLDNVTNIATGAQKTATLLSDDLNKLDNEAIKKATGNSSVVQSEYTIPNTDLFYSSFFGQFSKIVLEDGSILNYFNGSVEGDFRGKSFKDVFGSRITCTLKNGTLDLTKNEAIGEDNTVSGWLWVTDNTNAIILPFGLDLKTENTFDLYPQNNASEVIQNTSWLANTTEFSYRFVVDDIK